MNYCFESKPGYQPSCHGGTDIGTHEVMPRPVMTPLNGLEVMADKSPPYLIRTLTLLSACSKREVQGSYLLIFNYEIYIFIIQANLEPAAEFY